MSTQQQETRETTGPADRGVPGRPGRPAAAGGPRAPPLQRRPRAGWSSASSASSPASGRAGTWRSADADRAAEELAVEQARTAELQAEAAQYAQVPAILASVDRAESALATAMATDIEWYRYLSQIGQSAPEGVWFPDDHHRHGRWNPAVPGGDPLAPVDAVAEVVTTGRALAYADVATWMDTRRRDQAPGLRAVQRRDPRRGDGRGPLGRLHHVSAKVPPEAYSDRYAPKAE